MAAMVLGLAFAVSPSADRAAQAQAVVSNGQSFVTGHLLPGARQADGSRIAGLRLTLAEGWKTYWRSPGEAGIPPSFDWSKSTNVASVEVLWPRPDVFTSFGLQTIGYSGQIVLPVVVTPKDPAKPIDLALTADMGVCNEICVLEQFSIDETITADQRDIGTAQIDRARATVPPAGAAAGLDVAECRITGAGRERHLELRLTFREALSAPVVVVEGAPDTWISDVVSRQSGVGALDVEAKVTLTSDSGWINRSDLRMTVLADNMSADIRGCTAPAG